MYPTLHQLQIFVTVAQRHSFARAAEDLYLSAPSVSLQIQRLERHYGTRIFDRTSQGPVLTPAGRVLFEAAEAICARLNDAAERIRTITEASRTKLGIGATLEVGVYWLPTVVGVFSRRFPLVEIALQIGSRAQVEEALLQRTIEAAVTGRESQSPHLRTEPLILEPLALLAHPDSPIASLDRVPTSALAGETYLMREPGSLTRMAVDDAVCRFGLRFADVLEVQGMDGLVSAIGENRGIGFGPASFVEMERRLGQIAVREIAAVEIKVPFYLAYRQDHRLSDAAQAFVQCSREVPT